MAIFNITNSSGTLYTITTLDPQTDLFPSTTTDVVCNDQKRGDLRAELATFSGVSYIEREEIDVQQRWTAVVSPSALGNQSTTHNYNPAGLDDAAVLRLLLAGIATLTGLAGGVAGRVIAIVNSETNALRILTINDDDGNSSAANRFLLPGSVALAIPAGGAALFWYDGADSRWRLLA